MGRRGEEAHIRNMGVRNCVYGVRGGQEGVGKLYMECGYGWGGGILYME